jgi:nucleoid DNA-binding protein
MDELADTIAGKVHSKFRVAVSRRVIKFIIRQIFNTIIEYVAEGKNVTIAKFGTFSAREAAEREGICVLPVYNPKSANREPKHFYSPAQFVPKFKPGTSFRYYVNNPNEVTEELKLAETEGSST